MLNQQTIIRRRHARRGMSLMEVLISAFVLTMGLLGLASLIPAGKMLVNESFRADRAGACGRSALHEMKIRQMLDYNNWSDKTAGAGGKSFVIDPLGSGTTLGPMPRVTLSNVPTPADVFRWKDDVVDSGATTPGDYSWFLSVTPAESEASLPVDDRRHFTVSVVVCYQRQGTVKTSPVTAFLDSGMAGGSITLGSSLGVKEGDWIALCSSGGVCQWYRVTSVGDPATNITVSGPDWDVAKLGNATALAIPAGVVGVYTTGIEVDHDMLAGN